MNRFIKLKLTPNAKFIMAATKPKYTVHLGLEGFLRIALAENTSKNPIKMKSMIEKKE